MARLPRALLVLILATIGVSGGALVGTSATAALENRAAPHPRPDPAPAAAAVKGRFATFDLATIPFRGELRGESYDRHREIVSRHAAVIDACIAECEALAAEAHTEPAGVEREKVGEEVREILASIARREGFERVLNRPYLEGTPVWDEEEQVPYAPLASCPDLSVEVAVAMELPPEVFEEGSEYWRTRRDLVGEYDRLREPPPWVGE